MISFLLDLGASPNMVDLKGRSPAMRAAEFGHTQALTLLAEADTDLSSKESLCSLLLAINLDSIAEVSLKCKIQIHLLP